MQSRRLSLIAIEGRVVHRNGQFAGPTHFHSRRAIVARSREESTVAGVYRFVSLACRCPRSLRARSVAPSSAYARGARPLGAPRRRDACRRLSPPPRSSLLRLAPSVGLAPRGAASRASLPAPPFARRLLAGPRRWYPRTRSYGLRLLACASGPPDRFGPVRAGGSAASEHPHPPSAPDRQRIRSLPTSAPEDGVPPTAAIRANS